MVRGGPSYTVVTLDALRDLGIVDPWFIPSAEALAGFPEWQEPDRILRISRLAVVPRPGFEAVDAGWVAERFPASGAGHVPPGAPVAYLR